MALPFLGSKTPCGRSDVPTKTFYSMLFTWTCSHSFLLSSAKLCCRDLTLHVRLFPRDFAFPSPPQKNFPASSHKCRTEVTEEIWSIGIVGRPTGFPQEGRCLWPSPGRSNLPIITFTQQNVFTWAQHGAFRFVPYAYLNLVPLMLRHHTRPTDKQNFLFKSISIILIMVITVALQSAKSKKSLFPSSVIVTFFFSF